MIRPSRILALILLLTGVGLLSVIFFPIFFSTVRFHLFSPPRLIDPTAVSAYPAPHLVDVLGLTSIDYSRPEAWFEVSPSPPAESPPQGIRYYTVSLPRQNIFDAPVEIAGTDLKKNAIHYSGSALPGSYGNTVIFGHSSLPYLYRPGNPLTIFNPLVKAEVGDEVIIKYDGVTYKYLIKETKEVSPKQIEVLSQRYDRKELTLITCVPLGTYWRRFVARAELLPGI